MSIDDHTVREEAFARPYELDLRDALHRLAQLEPALDAPYLTVTLDWRPQGDQPNLRPARRIWADDSQQLREGFESNSPEHDSVVVDIARIDEFLDEQLDSSAQGVFIVACSAHGVFEALPLQVPLENRIELGPTPALSALAKLVEEHLTCAVLLLDQKDAVLSFITQAAREGVITVAGDDWPNRSQQGGFSQLRFQNSVNERIEGFAKDVAERTRAALEERGIEMLVLAGNETILGPLRRALHETVAVKVIGEIPLDIRSSEREIIDAALPLIAAADRERERAAVQLVQDNLGTGELAVAGSEDVLTALQAGQVRTLVMTDDFVAEGWADYSLPVWGAGQPPRQHPAGGDDDQLISVELREELVRLALQTSADIEIVDTRVPVEASEEGRIPDAGARPPRSDAAAALDQLGGVAAILRYALAVDQTTAEL